MKNWTNLPPWTSQFSVKNRVDAMDCLSESLGNVVYMVTGFDSSPRALAKLSKTTLDGNSEVAVLAAANDFGLIPYPMWESPHDFDWALYYQEIPADVLKSALRVKITPIPPDLNKSPLWTILRFPNGAQHGVCQINETQYFDSEQGDPVKPLTYGGAKIISQVSLIIQFMISCKTVKFADGKTLGIMIDSPNTTNIYKVANTNGSGEDEWRSFSKPDSYGKQTVNPDGTTNWNAEVQLNF